MINIEEEYTTSRTKRRDLFFARGTSLSQDRPSLIITVEQRYLASEKRQGY
jgi:hypothetical protein